MKIEESKFYKVGEAANILGVKSQTIWNWNKSGKIITHNIGSQETPRYRIKGIDILNILNK